MGEDNSLQGKKFSSARKLIPIWIELEKERIKAEEKPRLLAVDKKVVDQIKDALSPLIEPEIKPEILEKIKKESTVILKKWNKKVSAEQVKKRLPMQFERDQKIMNFKRFLTSDKQLVSPNALEKREDIFKQKVRGEAEVKCDFINTEGNPDVNKVENWAIWAYAWAVNGGDAYYSGLYWRYRIWVPNFDTSIQPDRRLIVTPRAVLDGYYSMFVFPFSNSAFARVTNRYYTGIWHHHYKPSGYDSEWVGWRNSYPVVEKQLTAGNIHYEIDIPYPGTEIRSPAAFPPPGVMITPNPVNNYAVVQPYDVVDFYVKPEVRVETNSVITYAKLDFSLIDVPFVTVEYATGYLL